MVWTLQQNFTHSPTTFPLPANFIKKKQNVYDHIINVLKYGGDKIKSYSS